MCLGTLNIPQQIIGQVGIKIKMSVTGGKESTPLQRIYLNQDGKASSVNKISLPNLLILIADYGISTFR